MPITLQIIRGTRRLYPPVDSAELLDMGKCSSTAMAMFEEQ